MKRLSIISLLFTILFISFIFWNRLVRVRTPKDFKVPDFHLYYDFFDKTIILYVSIFFFIMFVYYAINLLKQLNILPLKENSKYSIYKAKILEYLESKSWIISLTEFIRNHIVNGPSTVYEYVYRKIIYVGPPIEYMGTLLYKYFFNKALIFYILGFVIPLIIPSTIFIIEIIIYQQIKYF